MEINRLSGKRWFGAIKKAFVSCPTCNKVHRLSDSAEAKKRGWAPRIQRLRCECGSAWYLGMLAWPSRSGGGSRGAVPIDAVPTKEEAEELVRVRGEMAREREGRAQYKNLVIEGVKRRKGDPVNVVIKGEEKNGGKKQS